jgi:TRAP-type C4-dicarboxylate transport system permease small subunit
MRSLIRIVDKANKALEVLVGIALAAMTLLIFVQVLVRFVFAKLNIQFSVPWTEELSRYLMIWAIFIGAAIVARRADALAVEALVQAVPAVAGRAIKFAAHLMALAFYACIFYVGLQWAEFGRSETAPVLGVPMLWVYSSMSVGAALTIVNAVVLLIETVLEKKDILEVIDYEMEEALHDAELALAERKA